MMKYGLLMQGGTPKKIQLREKVDGDIITDIEADLMSALKPSSYDLNESISDMFGSGWFLKYDYRDACFTVLGDFVEKNLKEVLDDYDVEYK